MILAVLGDVHGDFAALDRLMALHPDVAAWLSVGDIAGDAGTYPAPTRPFYFIQGNNEDFDVLARLASGDLLAPNLHFVGNGQLTLIGQARVAGLGGTYAPKWYQTPPERLPARKRDDKRRHFVHAQVEACLALRGVDLFLTHEAAKPYWAGSGSRRNDAGKAVINEILASMRPRLHFFGHHHRFTESVREGVPSIGLPLAADGCVLVDTDTWGWLKK